MKIQITQEQVKAELCRRSFYYFVKEFWETIINETPVWNWHIEYLCNELQGVAHKVKDRLPNDYDWLIINVPPGSSKSTIISIFYPLWVWTIDYSQRFICGSYSATVSEDLADKAKKVFTHEKYRTYFPYVGVRSDAKTKLENKHNAERYTTSTGSGITGIHAHQIIIDDPLSTQNATSEVDRNSANKWITETLGSRKVDKAVTVSILVMQRLHENDPTGFLLSKDDIRCKHICIPAELPPLSDNNVYPIELRDKYIDGLFDPIRANLNILNSQRTLLGTYGYAGQFSQRPSDLSGGIIKRNWFEIVDKFHSDKVKRFQLDTAYTSKKENDPSGILAYFVEDNTIYITNWESHRLEFPELTKFVINNVQAHGYSDKSLIRVEPKASGKSLVQQIQKETNLNIVESDNPEKDKVTRATAVTAKMEAGRVKLIRGAWNDAFLDELSIFPKGKHDEAVDCLVEAVRNELIDAGWSRIS